MLKGGRTCPIGVRERERERERGSGEMAVARQQAEVGPFENGILL